LAYVNDSSLQLYLDAKDYPSSSTSTTWADKSGYVNNMTLSGFAYNGTTSGWTGESLATDGVNDKSVSAVLSNAPITSNFTLELLIKIKEINRLQWLFVQTGTGGYQRRRIVLNANNTITIGALNGANTNTNLTTSQTYAMDSLLHIVYKQSGTSLTLYINGVIIGTQTLAGGTVSANYGDKFYLFYDYVGANYFNGATYLVRGYTRALTDAEVTQNYNDAIGGGTPVTNDLIATISSTANNQATLNITKSISGNIANASTVSANLNVVVGNSLSGNITSAGSINANLSKDVNLIGSINVASFAQTSINTIIASLSGNIVASSALSLNISKTVNLIGNIGSSTNSTSNLTNIPMVGLSGNITSTSSALANISKNINLNANISIVSSTQGNLNSVRTLTGSVFVDSTAGATINKTINLIGNINCTTSITSNIVVIQVANFNGNIVIVSSVQSSLTASKNLSGSVIVVSSAIAYANLAEIIFAELNMILNREYELNMKYIDEYDLNMIYSRSSEMNIKL
jgi:hypothetical protein